MSNSNFRIQSKQLFLTIPQIDASITKEVAMERLKSHFTGKTSIDCAMVSHEKHKDNGDHLHIYVNFNKTFQTIKKDYFDFIANKHPNIQSVKNRIHVIKYIMKDGDYITYNLDPETYIKEVHDKTVVKSKGAFHELTEDIKSGMSYRELRNKHANLFVKYAKHIDDYIRTEKFLKDEEDAKEYFLKELESIEWREWQQDVINKALDPNVDTRTIHWIHDSIGNSGKSTLARYLHDFKDAYIVPGGKHADIYRHYKNERIVIYDLPREVVENNDSIYSTMECFKNGYILDTKYEGSRRRFVPPHIFVFSNSMPNMSKLSKDRWNIIDLDDSKKIKHETFEIKQEPIQPIHTLEDTLKHIDDIDTCEEHEYMKQEAKQYIPQILALGLEHKKTYFKRFIWDKNVGKLWDSHLIEYIPLP